MTDDFNDFKVEVWLTELQKKVLLLYIQEGLTQKQIALKIYGNENKQSKISSILLAIERQAKFPITKAFSKLYPSSLYELNFRRIKHY
jgi:uncharacterized protein YpmB